MSSFTLDPASIASSIKYHAEFTPLFSRERFELPKAFFATAQSVRDALIANWNATYDHYEKMNVKQAYYLSMEFLQVRLSLMIAYCKGHRVQHFCLYAIHICFTIITFLSITVSLLYIWIVLFLAVHYY